MSISIKRKIVSEDCPKCCPNNGRGVIIKEWEKLEAIPSNALL